ncbi:unnamed protein product [Effrenium voratum]|uniref:Uncharacterized protein n=1 Tax=Effrenium voratum TaxID=2562239 RepID=A0AA36NMJ7_9DINO|nr:unnamed protein product [Effrenium voratum]CAJ1450213.1 unnamed protein product [Effrenium voratum]CAJ1451838.1 unnamed protein product [Effrenium voratum]
MEDVVAAMAQDKVCKRGSDGGQSNTSTAESSTVVVGKATSTESETQAYDRWRMVHNIMVDYISEMKLQHPDLCRSVPAYRILARLGNVLRGSRVGDTCCAYSTPTCRIRRFVSHSWHAAAWLKILSLLLFYNLKAAAIASQAAAFLMMVLFSLGKLPGFVKVVRYDPEPLFLAPWSSSTGILVFLAVLVFRRPKEQVFLDRLCIDQRDPAAKAQGVVSLGGVLKNSEELLVIWDRSYCERLWCNFELAAFLKAHEDEETVKVRVQPISLAILCITCFGFNVALCFGSITFPQTGSLSFVIAMLGVCIYGWMAGTAVMHHGENVETMQGQLQSFSAADTKCYCCSKGHHALDGSPTPCDREILLQCIQLWFGSIAEFEMSMKDHVRGSLAHHLGGMCYPYGWMIASHLPAFWLQMDFAAGEWNKDKVVSGLGYFLTGVYGLFVVCPLWISSIYLCVRWSSGCHPVLRKLFATAFAAGLALAIQISLIVFVDMYPDTPILGIALWAGVLLVPSLVLWWRAACKRLATQVIGCCRVV